MDEGGGWPIRPCLTRGARIGLYGGSFNPAHDGHRRVSLEALKRLRLDWVWWLVSPQNPLKSSRGMAPAAERLRLARQKLGHHPRMTATMLETKLGTRFTVDTLRALVRQCPDAEFHWIMGADNLQQMAHWRHWPEIFRLSTVVVFARDPYTERALRGLVAIRMARKRRSVRALARSRRHPAGWTLVSFPLQRISASQIRARRHGDGPPQGA